MKKEMKQRMVKIIVACVFFMVSAVNMTAQTYLTGPTSANQGETKFYYLYDPSYDIDVQTVLWSSDGTIQGSDTGVDYANIYWDYSGSMQEVYAEFSDYSWNYYYESIYVNVTASAPSIPLNPTVQSSSPGSVTLQRTGSPPSGVTWYWQTSASGTSTSLGSGSTKTVTTGSVYYIRARNNSGGLWSSGSGSVSYTIPPLSGGCDLSDENYVHTITPTVETTNLSSVSNSDKIETVAYFDGLGRPMQQIDVRAGGQSQDIITHITYDDFGRQTKEYLPYAETSSCGLYRTNALSATNTYYDSSTYNDDFPGMTTSTINPYSEKLMESSPLSRVLEQGAPGKDWKIGENNEIEFEYESNEGTEVKRYDVTLSYSSYYKIYTPTLVDNGNYGANELYKSVVKDENHDGTSANDHTTEEFKDKQGRVVLKRTYNNEVQHDTYYVYDDYGNLTYVLPPKAEADVNKPTSTELNNLCYQYKYDGRNRLAEKKLPGKGWEYIVYNNLDQPILTQDDELDSQNKWLFTKYDAFGRVAYTGIISSFSSRTTLQNSANGASSQKVTKSNSSITIAGTTIYYDNGAYPTSISEIYTINYYDDYTFDKVSGNSESSYGVTPITDAKGLATGSKVRVLGTNDWITTVTYYDEKSRPIYVYSNNAYLNTTDKVKNELDFVGNVTESTTTHAKTGESTITTYDYYTYDHMNRVTSHDHKINSLSSETIVDNTYDSLGQLITKGIGNTATSGTRLQTINYAYNVRGWLKEINDVSSLGSDLFAFEINYNDPTTGTALYNGNISQANWKSASASTTEFKYTYDYDDLNRITDATFTGNATDRYNLEDVAYDKNGNITSLKRRGHTNSGATTFGLMDDLVYTYNTSSNQLKKVLDNGNDNYGFIDGSNTTTEFTYDDNGNMLRDLNKGISSNIAYNHLNLPTQVTLSGGNIQYIYDATGVKLKKIVSTGNNTLYAGNYIYEGSSGSEDLKFFSHPEGFVEHDNGSFDYVFQYKDHLGNIRLNYKDDNGNGSVTSSEIQEENHYYPFGLKHKGYGAPQIGTDHKYEFQGQETQDELGLNWQSFKWRNHDPAIGRFMSIDPLAEDYNYQSPYNFSENRVIDGIELEGLEHVSHTVYSVHKDSNGNYNATYSRSAYQENVGDWSGIKHQNTYNVYNGNGLVSSIYSGDNSVSNMSRDGISLSSQTGKDVSFSEIYEATKDNKEFQNAGKTMNNVFASIGLVFGGAAIAAGEGSIILYMGLTSDANELLGGLDGKATDAIENENFQKGVTMFEIMSAVGSKGVALDNIGKGEGNVMSIYDILKSYFDIQSKKNDEEEKDNDEE